MRLFYPCDPRCKRAVFERSQQLIGEAMADLGEELTFWGGDAWSVLFAEGVFPICQPYGVLANFTGDTLVGFDDLSGAEEG